MYSDKIKSNEMHISSNDSNHFFGKNKTSIGDEIYKIEDQYSDYRIKCKNFQVILGLLEIFSSPKEKIANNRIRMQKSIFQRSVLEDVFVITKFPNRQVREELALLLNHSTRGIQIWFQNQRNKLEISREEMQKEKENGKIIDTFVFIKIFERNMPKNERKIWYTLNKKI